MSWFRKSLQQGDLPPLELRAVGRGWGGCCLCCSAFEMPWCPGSRAPEEPSSPPTNIALCTLSERANIKCSWRAQQGTVRLDKEHFLREQKAPLVLPLQEGHLELPVKEKI